MDGLVESRNATQAKEEPPQIKSAATSSVRASAASSARADWADVARGIGIILVVFEHAARGIVNAGIAPYSDAFKLQDAAIYSFHMPLFFFLSGCFFGRGSSLAQFARSKFVHIAYPYVLWSVLLGTASIAASDLVNNPTSWSQLVGIFVQPIQQFWFLYALFLCHWAGYVVRPLSALLALAAAAHVATAFTGVPNIVLTTAHYFIYFAFGAWGARYWMKADHVSRAVGAAIGAGSAAAAAALFLTQAPPYALASFPPADRFGLAALGIAAVCGISVLLQEKAPLLSKLGRASMAIYVMHTVFSAGTRIALQRAGVTDPILHNVFGTIIGLAAPYLAFLAAKRAGATTLLGFGR